MDFNESSKPIYMQIADRICDDISSGVYAPETRIPSVREYAGKLQVNANTVMRSYEHLSAMGVIYNKRGIGFFVSAAAREAVETLRAETFFKDEMGYFFGRLSNMDVTPAALAQHYIDYLNSKSLEK